MTEITYTNRDGHIRVTITGHAMFNPGNDPVCAAISSHAYQLLSYVAAMQMEGQVEGVTSEVKDGWVIVDFVVPPEERQAWEIAWKVLRMGFTNIAEAYPQNVSVNWSGALGK